MLNGKSRVTVPSGRRYSVATLIVAKLSSTSLSFTDYIRFIESEVGVPVTILSVGPDREQTIILND